jgi:hypothetical protein
MLLRDRGECMQLSPNAHGIVNINACCNIARFSASRHLKRSHVGASYGPEL